MIITKDTYSYIFHHYIDGYGTDQTNTNWGKDVYHEFGNTLDYQVKDYYIELMSRISIMWEGAETHYALTVQKNDIHVLNEAKSTNSKFDKHQILSQPILNYNRLLESPNYYRKANNWGCVVKNFNGKRINFNLINIFSGDYTNVAINPINTYFQAYGLNRDLNAIWGVYALQPYERGRLFKYGDQFSFLIRPHQSIERPLDKTLCLVMSSQERDKDKYMFGSDCVIKLNPINGGYKYYKAVIKSFLTRLDCIGEQPTEGLHRAYYNLCSKGLDMKPYGFGGAKRWEWGNQGGLDEYSFMGAYKVIQETTDQTRLQYQQPSYNTNILTIKDEPFTRDITFKTFLPLGREPNYDNITTFFQFEETFPNGWIDSVPVNGYTIYDQADWLIEMVLYGYN